MDLQLKDKTVLITGAANGIGRATAQAFGREGCRVVVVDMDSQGGQETARLIQQAKGESQFKQVDVCSSQEFKNAVDFTLENYGALDVLVNNAGIEGDQAPLDQSTEANWDRVITTNLKSVWRGMKLVIPHMVKQGGGAIVNVASVAGLVGFTGLSAYNASKAGIILLTKTVALENATIPIRVNAVCPGVIKTPMVERMTKGDKTLEEQFSAMEPVKRMGLPEEIAQAIVWLSSASASFVTGHAMVVDGGLTAQ